MNLEFEVILYGATGYTGRLVAAELDRLGASFLLAGRDRGRLAALSSSLPSRPPAAAVELSDAAGLASLARRGGAFLACAGPFEVAGRPLVEACLAARTPYADITGEQSFLRWTWEQDTRARQAGIPLVNAVGFDVVPSDLASVLAARRTGPPATLDLAIASRGGLSGGTRRSMAAAVGRGYWYDDGRFRPGPAGRFARTFEFPGRGPRRCVFVPWGDVVTAPRSTGARRVRTFFALPPAAMRALRWTWPLQRIAPTYLRRRLGRKAAHAPEGPSAAERAEATFTIQAEARGEDGSGGRGVVTGRDPYGLTAASAARAAVRLARQGSPAGALTPSQAFDLEALAGELQAFDLTLHSGALSIE